MKLVNARSTEPPLKAQAMVTKRLLKPPDTAPSRAAAVAIRALAAGARGSAATAARTKKPGTSLPRKGVLAQRASASRESSSSGLSSAPDMTGTPRVCSAPTCRNHSLHAGGS